MAVSDRAAAIGTYAQQLLDNQEVQDTGRDAVAAIRGAYQRARGQDARDAVQDKKLRQRVTAAVTSVGELLGAVSETPPKPKSRWPRRIALLATAGAVLWLISDQTVRARIQGFAGATSSDAPTGPSTVDETSVPTVVDEPNASSISGRPATGAKESE